MKQHRITRHGITGTGSNAPNAKADLDDRIDLELASLAKAEAPRVLIHAGLMIVLWRSSADTIHSTYARPPVSGACEWGNSQGGSLDEAEASARVHLATSTWTHEGTDDPPAILITADQKAQYAYNANWQRRYRARYAQAVTAGLDKTDCDTYARDSRFRPDLQARVETQAA